MLSITQTEATRAKSGPSSKVAPDVPGIARIIKENWRKSVDGILKVAQECAKGNAARREVKQVQLPPLLICLYADTLPSDEQRTSMKSDAIEFADKIGLKIADFTGETAMADLKRHWMKKPQLI